MEFGCHLAAANAWTVPTGFLYLVPVVQKCVNSWYIKNHFNFFFLVHFFLRKFWHLVDSGFTEAKEVRCLFQQNVKISIACKWTLQIQKKKRTTAFSSHRCCTVWVVWPFSYIIVLLKKKWVDVKIKKKKKLKNGKKKITQKKK